MGRLDPARRTSSPGLVYLLTGGLGMIRASASAALPIQYVANSYHGGVKGIAGFDLEYTHI